MKRSIDLLLSIALIIISSPVLVLIALLVKVTSRGPALFVSDRVGKNNAIFRMFKFRTMTKDAPKVATHLMTDPDEFLTPIGGLLRRTSIDEIPQLLNVLKGEMSLIGPRPALFNQDDLVALRRQRGVDALTPGITGWAQTHGRDKASIPEKVELDAYYLENISFIVDIEILWLTMVNVVTKKGISH